MHLAPSHRNLPEPSSPPLYAGRKLRQVEQALMWTILQDDPQCSTRRLLDQIALSQPPIAVSLRQVNRWRAKWQHNRTKGRRRGSQARPSGTSTAAVVQLTPQLALLGVHLFLHWLEQLETFAPIISELQAAIEAYRHTHPDEDFALLHHRESTLKRRLQALVLAPLLGIDTLTAFDTREHPLPTLIGRGYQSSTLTQFLGQLERMNAAEVLMRALIPTTAGRLAYVDGHMIAYWSRRPLHKGKITMLGRIMAGSQAVITHNESGHALFLIYYPPDLSLSQVIVEYCQQVAEASGSVVFVIDRAVNSVAVARAFEAQGLGLLCMLNDNEHQGLESFEATQIGVTDEGIPLYSGPWKVARDEDPRQFVITQSEAGKTLVYWGTPRVQAILEPAQWPRVYRERNELQENSFKRMKDHGALETNYGRQIIVGPDRHQQRKRNKLERSLGKATERVDTRAKALAEQQAKVAESEAKGHGKRLEQRQHAQVKCEEDLQAAEQQQAKLTENLEAIGEAKERADRDYRKQTIMTWRTLLLENLLMTFLGMLCGHLQSPMSLECLLTLFFERSGSRMETASEVLYWVSTTGLSLPKRRLMAQIVDGLNAMGLKDQGKSIHVRLKDRPP